MGLVKKLARSVAVLALAALPAVQNMAAGVLTRFHGGSDDATPVVTWVHGLPAVESEITQLIRANTLPLRYEYMNGSNTAGGPWTWSRPFNVGD